MMPDAPIFLLGTERSGSNLLRLLLDAHPRIAVPHPPHVVRYFTPLEAGYGDLGDDRNLRALVDDILRLVRVHINPWNLPLDAERLVREAQPRSVFGVYCALQDQYLASTEKARWGCKSTFMIDHVADILARYPDARLILLVRDPRDVAASSRQSVFSTFHPRKTAHLWRGHQETGLAWADRLGGTGRENLRILRYEDLVAAPDAELRALCAWLGEDFAPEMLRFFEGKEARRSAALSESWANTGKPVDAGSVARFRAELSERELQLVEAVARGPMRRLGYTTVFDDTTLDAVAPGRRERAGIDAEEARLRATVELRSLLRDRNVGRRWARGAWLSWLELRRGRA